MNLLRKALVPLAGAAIIVLVLSIGGPRAVHAVVAALVQVENTPTSAVPTVAAPAASQLYSSSCRAGFGTSNSATCTFTTVPAGQTLFIETESIRVNPSHGIDPILAAIEPVGPLGSQIYLPIVQQAVDILGNDTFLGTTAGRIWAQAGAIPNCVVSLVSPPDLFLSGGIACTISGYLAPAM